MRLKCFILQTARNRSEKGCSLCPYLFHIVTDDIVDYTKDGKSDSPVVKELRIAGLFLVDKSEESFFTSVLQRQKHQTATCCKKWSLKCNLLKTKVMVFKKGKRLKRIAGGA